MSNKKKKKISEAPSVQISLSEPDEKWVIAGCAAIYALIVIWGLLSKGTWDDDCPTRYYNVRHALNDPKQFLGLWNRPLFTLLYVLPIQLGRISVIFETALIAILAGYFLYRAAKEMKLPNAYLAIPFTALQTFYFPVAFNALTEPLAALILALGIFFHVRKQYLAFAITGALLPLARLELSPLLVFWAGVLLLEKQWKYVLLLGVPTILWSLIGTLVDGNLFWLYDQVFTGQENRYGHGSFWQYPQRFIFLTGPVIFYFFMLGFGERLYQRKLDFVLLQFVAGFLIYIVFSWKLSIGQAAGFLRNLLPLSPLAALVALEGYNLWIGHEVPLGKIAPAGQKNVRVPVYSGLAIILTAIFLSRKLIIHHIVGPETEYVKLGMIVALTFIFLLKSYLFGATVSQKLTRFVFPALVIGGALAYTLMTEPPIGLIPERAAMQQVAEWYKKNNLSHSKTYVNHIWFFYAGDFDYYDNERFARVKRANLAEADPSSIVIWESHYGHRLFGDVQMEDLINNPSFKEIGRIVTPDQRFAVLIFQKL